MSSAPVLNGQYCEVCAEYYNRNKVPAAVYVLDQWICAKCEEGLEPPSNQHLARWRVRVRQELRVKPPQSESVIPEPFPEKDEWAVFFRELLSLPPGGSKAIIPRGNFKTEDRYLRKAGAVYGIQLRIWKIDHKLYVAASNGKRPRR